MVSIRKRDTGKRRHAVLVRKLRQFERREWTNDDVLVNAWKDGATDPRMQDPATYKRYMILWRFEDRWNEEISYEAIFYATLPTLKQDVVKRMILWEQYTYWEYALVLDLDTGRALRVKLEATVK